jgi:hypothetical protein
MDLGGTRPDVSKPTDSARASEALGLFISDTAACLYVKR